MPRLGQPAARSGVPRHRGKAYLRDELWLRGMGPAVRRATTGGTPSVPRDPGRDAPRRIDSGRFALSHPRRAAGSLLRARDADHVRSATRLPSKTKSMPSAILTTAICSVSSTAPRTRSTPKPSRRHWSATTIPPSPAAVTLSFRSICTIWRDGTHCRPRSRNGSSDAPRCPMSNWTTPSNRPPRTTPLRPSSKMGSRRRSSAPTVSSAVRDRASSALTSSAMRARRVRLSRCSRTCSSDVRRAITIAYWTSAARSPAVCSSRRRLRSSTA